MPKTWAQAAVGLGGIVAEAVGNHFGGGDPIPGITNTTLASAARTLMKPYGGSSGSATVHGQIFRKKGRDWGRRPPTKLQKMIRAYGATQNSYVARWQRLTTLNAPVCSTVLSNDYRATPDALLYLPMYAFNLTTLPFGKAADALGDTPDMRVSIPCYRLYKDIAAAQYLWLKIPQSNGGKDGDDNDLTWSVEWDTLNGQPAVQLSKYFVEWANAKMVVKGAQNRPVKIHTALVKFANSAGPARLYNSVDAPTSDQTVDFGPNGDDVIRNTGNWDKFWATKISNPIRTSKAPPEASRSDTFRILKHSSFVVGADTSINNDKIPLQVLHSQFYNVNALMKCNSPDITYTQSDAIVGDTTQGPGFGYLSNQLNRFQLGNNTGLFPEQDKDHWFVVWADVFDQSKDNVFPDGKVVGPNSDANIAYGDRAYWPSFDINLRVKFSYND